LGGNIDAEIRLLRDYISLLNRHIQRADAASRGALDKKTLEAIPFFGYILFLVSSILTHDRKINDIN